MRAAFLGTPAAAVPSLAALVDVADVLSVVTRPDRPKGRSGRPSPPPVKIAAREWGLSVAQPETHDDLYEVLAPLQLDIAVVVAYGRILKPNVLGTARSGFVNVHLSLLPRWRGPAPVERAILAGDETTGVSLMLIDEGLDTGPVISVIETPIADDETGGSLTARLSYLGAKIIDDALPDYVAGRLSPAAQIAAGSSHAPLLTVAEARVTGRESAATATRMVRAFHPRPGAWCSVDGERLKLLHVVASEEAAPPGIITTDSGRALLGLEDGSVELLVVQPAGKRQLDGSAWAHGRRGQPATLDRGSG